MLSAEGGSTVLQFCVTVGGCNDSLVGLGLFPETVQSVEMSEHERQETLPQEQGALGVGMFCRSCVMAGGEGDGKDRGVCAELWT